MGCNSGGGLAQRMNTMQVDKVTSCRLKVTSCVLLAGLLILRGLTGCSPKESVPAPATNATATVSVPEDSDLLLRVRFAGTMTLMANTNAAYLTNIAALPETAALGQHIVERMATLPPRFLGVPLSNAVSSTNFVAVFSDFLSHGFVLELRGDSNGVRTAALAAPASPVQAQRWETALAAAALEVQDSGHVQIHSTNGWIVWLATLQTNNSQLSTLNSQPALPSAPSVLEVEMASTILPGSIQRSIYGGFKRFSFTAVPTDRGFKIRGNAGYAQDLPVLGASPVIPRELVTDPEISVSMVRNPAGWLASNSPIRSFLPQPVPDVVWFWGGDSSPYQLSVAVPYKDKTEFTNAFVPEYIPKLEKLAAATDSGPVVYDAVLESIRWGMVPFCSPQLTHRTAAGQDFLLAEVFPPANFTTNMTPALEARISAATNALVFDWEFTSARIDTWFRIWQLALLMANQKQLGAGDASTKWLQAVTKALPSGGNMFTAIVQVGPRELALDRLAPVGLSSIELFWLANWLESESFPTANFWVKAPPIIPPDTPNQPQQ
jgi:hypothetical protein